MERLPHIDEHSVQIAAGRERVWDALLKATRGMVAGPGFTIAESEPAARLALRGRHPFARYELIFELEDAAPGRARLRAITNAAFPGPHGRVYRALVIGSGGHRVAVRHMLRRIAAGI